MKVKDLPNGSIIWYSELIVGVKGFTLRKEYYDLEVYKINGNIHDYEVDANKLNPDIKEIFDKRLVYERKLMRKN